MKRIKFLFAWYDLWVGIFWDGKKRKIYILPIPTIGVVIDCTQYYEIYSPHIGEAIGVCTHEGAEDALREDPGCELRPISQKAFDAFA